MDVYEKLETKYYQFVEWASDHGIPLDRVAMAIEGQGIPSFPVMLIAALIIIGGLYVAVKAVLEPTYVVTVYDANGHVLANYSLIIDGNTYTTDADGKIYLKNMPVSISAPGVGYRVRTEGKNPISVRLMPEVHQVKISVIDNEGKEIQNVTCQVHGESTLEVQGNPIIFYISFKKGNNTVAPYDDGSVKLTISAEGYRSRTITIPWSEGNVNTSVVLEREEPPHGSIILRTTPQINGTAILLKNNAPLKNTETIINGGYALITGVPYGTYVLKVIVIGEDSEEYELPENKTEVRVAQEVTQVSMNVKVPEKETTAKITVIDENTGDPVPDAYIYAEIDGNKEQLAKTDESGVASISIESPTDIYVEAKSYYEKGPVTVEPGDDKTIALQKIKNVGDVNVLVYISDAAGNALPLENAVVQLRTTDGITIAEAETGPEGTARFVEVCVGTYLVVAAKGNLYGSKKIHIDRGKTVKAVIDLNTGATLQVTTITSIKGVESPRQADIKIVTESGRVIFAAKTDESGRATVRVPLYEPIIITAEGTIDTTDGPKEIRVSKITRFVESGTYSEKILLEIPSKTGVLPDTDHPLNDGKVPILVGVPGKTYWIPVKYAVTESTGISAEVNGPASIVSVFPGKYATISKEGNSANITAYCNDVDICVGEAEIGISVETNAVSEARIRVAGHDVVIHTGPVELAARDSNTIIELDNTAPLEKSSTNEVSATFAVMREGTPGDVDIECATKEGTCDENNPHCMIRDVTKRYVGGAYTSGFLTFSISSQSSTVDCNVTVEYNGEIATIPLRLSFVGKLNAQKIAIVPDEVKIIDQLIIEDENYAKTYQIIGIPPTYHIVQYSVADRCPSTSAEWERVDGNSFTVSWAKLNSGRLVCVRSSAVGYKDAYAVSKITKMRIYPKILAKTLVMDRATPIRSGSKVYVPVKTGAEFNISCKQEGNLSCELNVEIPETEQAKIKVDANGASNPLKIIPQKEGNFEISLTPTLEQNGQRIGTLPKIPITLIVIPPWTKCVKVSASGPGAYVKTNGATIGSNKVNISVSLRKELKGCDKYTITATAIAGDTKKDLGTVSTSERNVAVTIKVPDVPGIARYINVSVNICCTKGCGKKACVDWPTYLLRYVNKVFSVTAQPKISDGGQICYEIDSPEGIRTLSGGGGVSGDSKMQILEDIDNYKIGGTQGTYVVKVGGQIPAKSAVISKLAIDSTTKIGDKEYLIYSALKDNYAMINPKTGCVSQSDMEFCQILDGDVLLLLNGVGIALNKEADVNNTRPKITDVLQWTGYDVVNRTEYPVTADVNSDNGKYTITLKPKEEKLVMNPSKTKQIVLDPPTLQKLLETEDIIHRVTITVPCAEENISAETSDPALIMMGPVSKVVPGRVADELEDTYLGSGAISNDLPYVAKDGGPCADIYANESLTNGSVQHVIDIPTLLAVSAAKLSTCCTNSKEFNVAIPPTIKRATSYGIAIIPEGPGNYYHRSENGKYSIYFTNKQNIPITTLALDTSTRKWMSIDGAQVSKIEFDGKYKYYYKYIAVVGADKDKKTFFVLSNTPLENSTGKWIYKWKVKLTSVTVKYCDNGNGYVIVVPDTEDCKNQNSAGLKYNREDIEKHVLIIEASSKGEDRWDYGPMVFALLGNGSDNEPPALKCGEFSVDLENTPGGAILTRSARGKVCAYSTSKFKALKQAYRIAWGYKSGASAFGTDGMDGDVFYLPAKYMTSSGAPMKAFDSVSVFAFVKTKDGVYGKEASKAACKTEDGTPAVVIGYWTGTLPQTAKITVGKTCGSGEVPVYFGGKTYCIPKAS